ncbi:hypothetical protein F5144DRAFT_323459 [Chaetomium tenue]|uniref:Uncharacterized protein n=1 Tax=Chaetomium tenue TaxID=1854479 RepID=A0ACB7P3V3_9PEZI|nr:hypothetical protein F5144DRAFT_323459 [Chaetomium globosum]
MDRGRRSVMVGPCTGFVLVLGPGWGLGESRWGGTKPPPAVAGYFDQIDGSAILQIGLRPTNAVFIMALVMGHGPRRARARPPPGERFSAIHQARARAHRAFAFARTRRGNHKCPVTFVLSPLLPTSTSPTSHVLLRTPISRPFSGICLEFGLRLPHHASIGR